jgi:hypothetical protein
MSTKDDGGPAFPTTPENLPGTGLSIRDHFAEKVLQAALVNATLPGVAER